MTLTVAVTMTIACACGRIGFDKSPLDSDAGVACQDDGSSCVASGVSGVCLGSECCVGCVEDGVCRDGNQADECGSGGGACSSCADDSFCERNECVSGRATQRIALGFKHGCAITEGRLYCWGDNSVGQLGLGDFESQVSPARVGSEEDWFAVAAGEEHTCGLRGPGELYCWGRNHTGAALLGDLVPHESPTLVRSADNWLQVDTGQDYTCARNALGELWCGGINIEAQLGQGTRSESIPELTQVGSDTDWTELACGRGHTCALRGSGELYCWGTNVMNQQGHSGGGDAIRAVPGPTDWQTVHGNTESTCGFRANGDLYCWGGNNFGLLGLGNTVNQPVPALVSANMRSWSSYIFHSCGITGAGRLACVGRAIEGQLGIDQDTAQLSIAEPTIGFDDWVEVAAGRFATCARRRESSIWCTGTNANGELGLGDTLRRRGFEAIVLPQ